MLPPPLLSSASVCVCVWWGLFPTEHVHIPLKPNSINTGYLFTANPQGGNAASREARQPPGQETCLLHDLGCPRKGWEAAGWSCQGQSHRQAGLPGISLHHLDQTHMVKQPPLPSLLSPLPQRCPHAGTGRGEERGERGCGMLSSSGTPQPSLGTGCLPASSAGNVGSARHPRPVGTCQHSPRERDPAQWTRKKKPMLCKSTWE